ncbi:MAG: class I fructose-bisphosphate aldolase [Candidatus Daviesbacteria bacterium]|nr:class I fructose-bisphosphate aldolase [Candidatus Daviesbacteria bacterium]
MHLIILKQTAKALVAPGKGILAADESTKTIQKRLEKIGVESTPETNLAYRRMLFTTPGIEQFLSGVILYDETIRQLINGMPVPKYLENRGIIPGIKVDKGADKIAEGLDGLQNRLTEYKNLGAKFAKWRAVIKVGEDAYIEENAEALARYAGLCQEQDIVPIVEPEVLMDGSHDLAKCKEVTSKVLQAVFAKLKEQGVLLEGMILKPNMVISGKESNMKASAQEIAEATIEVFKTMVPVEVPGIVFLSGGQTPDEATENLKAINEIGGPWQLSYSYGRALQEEALKIWSGKDENVAAAQQTFLDRCKKVSATRSVRPG